MFKALELSRLKICVLPWQKSNKVLNINQRLNVSSSIVVKEDIKEEKEKPIRINNYVISVKVDKQKNQTICEPIDTLKFGGLTSIKANDNTVGIVPTPSTTTNVHACSLCRLNLKNLNYTDVLILEQFLAQDGSLLTQQQANLCRWQYCLVKKLVLHARRCNLLKRPPDYFVPGPWHDLNTYKEIDRKRDQPMRVIQKKWFKG